jgi:hypothetical protein
MLSIGNETARVLYGVNTSASTNAKIIVDAINDDGRPTDVDTVTLSCGNSYTAQVNNGVAIFNNLPTAT